MLYLDGPNDRPFQVVLSRLCGTLPVAIGAALASVLFLHASPAPAQLASTIQLPTFGVAVDADGVLSVKAFTDPTGQLRALRAAAAGKALAADIRQPSEFRKISLVRLQRAISLRIQAGESPTENMRYLAGLWRLQYVFCYPETNEIVIAGPAEGWLEDNSGRIVGITTGRPVLEARRNDHSGTRPRHHQRRRGRLPLHERLRRLGKADRSG